MEHPTAVSGNAGWLTASHNETQRGYALGLTFGRPY